ncbi:NUDIX hydrolase [Megasphaera cerevisiae DSM 20462]|jgi:8-oxo-dGTP pyrophosphatase MutT (NUDIX family)|uniref:NUDIX hydrolase n=1 Tax=Megasphaera cerevisiae DSM 20462 TaxID=1122219 RepID=A0A0J6ZNQ3_9FIRM|nr:CoA pyrophosphatase [Megasphaera cerevisiae]KMO86496.1 NUDIX hydrolase [Megasphaera cerevisiae DSM 20462]MCI1749852.1 CoA pyrophosphatase [Megasphaera cerevisiae]SJZ91267.1 8-oxo-dGTP pyrophosphatase MutT, NUDIX family [Megasphaera cerevisiae DSM 20462]
MTRYEAWPERVVRQNLCMNNKLCAVVVPVIYIDGAAHLVFEVRSSTLDWQPGEICFPGGAIEPSDDSAEAAALRETEEELGIHSSRMYVWGPLDYVESPVGVTVWPFAAYLDTTAFKLSKNEIDHIFTVPVGWFEDHKPTEAKIELATRPADGFPVGLELSGQTEWEKRQTYNVYIYHYNGYKIWGITAHIIRNFLDIQRQMAGSADEAALQK